MRVRNYQFAFKYRNESSSLSSKLCIMENMVAGNSNVSVNINLTRASVYKGGKGGKYR
jgi:hypothetical protein